MPIEWVDSLLQKETKEQSSQQDMQDIDTINNFLESKTWSKENSNFINQNYDNLSNLQKKAWDNLKSKIWNDINFIVDQKAQEQKRANEVKIITSNINIPVTFEAFKTKIRDAIRDDAHPDQKSWLSNLNKVFLLEYPGLPTIAKSNFEKHYIFTDPEMFYNTLTFIKIKQKKTDIQTNLSAIWVQNIDISQYTLWDLEAYEKIKANKYNYKEFIDFASDKIWTIWTKKWLSWGVFIDIPKQYITLSDLDSVSNFKQYIWAVLDSNLDSQRWQWVNISANGFEQIHELFSALWLRWKWNDTHLSEILSVLKTSNSLEIARYQGISKEAFDSDLQELLISKYPWAKVDYNSKTKEIYVSYWIKTIIDKIRTIQEIKFKKNIQLKQWWLGAINTYPITDISIQKIWSLTTMNTINNILQNSENRNLILKIPDINTGETKDWTLQEYNTNVFSKLADISQNHKSFDIKYTFDSTFSVERLDQINISNDSLIRWDVYNIVKKANSYKITVSKLSYETKNKLREVNKKENSNKKVKPKYAYMLWYVFPPKKTREENNK